MRKKGRSAVVVVGAVALAAVIAAAVWPGAGASPTRVAVLEKTCLDDRAFHRRALPLRELAEIDSADSRAAPSPLAGAKDERLPAPRDRMLNSAPCTCGRTTRNVRSVTEARRQPRKETL